MSQRITQANLEGSVLRLNKMTGSPETPYKRIDGRNIAQVGCFILDGAYGGWKLARITNSSGGQTNISEGGYIPKKDLYYQIHGIINFKYATE